MADTNLPNDTGNTDGSDNSVQFAELGLAVGSTLSIETISPVRKYAVRLLGYAEGRSLLISAPLRDGREVLLEKDASLTVRLLEGRKVCAFETRVIYRSVQPYTYYHLAYPDQIESMQIRDSERIDTVVDTLVDSDFDIVGEWPKQAKINNLSKTGARVVSSNFLGELGHELIVEFDLDVSGMNKCICLTGIVRNAEHKAATDDRNRYVVGIQFVDLTDEARLTLANFIYEHGKSA